MGKAKESLCDLYGRSLRCITHGWIFEDRKKILDSEQEFSKDSNDARTYMHAFLASERTSDAVVICFKKSRTKDRLLS